MKKNGPAAGFPWNVMDDLPHSMSRRRPVTGPAAQDCPSGGEYLTFTSIDNSGDFVLSNGAKGQIDARPTRSRMPFLLRKRVELRMGSSSIPGSPGD